MNKNDWVVIGVSLQGDSHVGTATCKQDAIHWLPEKPDQLPIILSVADGHGSQSYFRSGIGAKFSVLATEKALLELLSHLQSRGEPGPVSETECRTIKSIKDYLETKLIKYIWRYWRQFVDLYQTPNDNTLAPENSLLEQEIKKASTIDLYSYLPPEKRIISHSPKDHQYTPYGATLLSCSITDQFVFYIQLGDGNIGCVTENGVYYSPLGKNPSDLIANETYSFISEDFDRKTRVSFEPYLLPERKYPAFIILATDGLANAYVSESGFEKFALDIHARLMEAAKVNGEDFAKNLSKSVSQNLPQWAKHASSFTGDDVSIGLLVRCSAYI